MTDEGRDAGALSPADKIRLNLEELKLRVDAYQKYLGTGLQVNAFYYAVTGGVIGFYLNRPDGRVVFFLLLPIFMGAVLGGIFLHGAGLQKKAAEKIKDIVRDMRRGPEPNLNVRDLDDIDLLRVVLTIFGATFLLVSAVLTVMPVLRAYVKNYYVPWELALFGGVAACALVVGGSAAWAVNLVFRCQRRRERRRLRK